jgi:hypothetical protein
MVREVYNHHLLRQTAKFHQKLKNQKFENHSKNDDFFLIKIL